ncbi:MAG TPA: MFS transporter [Acidimicrobiia bacterium]|nr:MFS transporter [Acidimicrobiia bacterium]
MVRQSFLSRWFALVFLSAFASELCSSLLVHFPGYLLELGANEVRIGLIVGVAGLATILVRPWAGRVMDLHSRRLVIRIGTLMVAVSTLAMGFIGHLGVAVVTARLFQGIGQAVTITAFWTYIADRIPAENRTQGIALFGISGLLPMGIAPAIGDGILTTEWGYQGLFVVAASFAVIAFVLSLFLERSGVNVGATTTGFRAVLRSETLRPVWVATAFLSIAFTTTFIFIKTYVTTTGLNSVGPFFAAFALSAVVWRLVFGRIPDRVGPKRIVGPGLALYAAGLAIVGLVGGTGGLAVGGLVTGLGHGITYPVVLAIATMRAPVGDRGTVTATFTAVFDLVLFSIAPVLGLVIGAFGYPAMFLTVAGALLVGIGVFYRFDRGHGGTLAAIAESATAPVPHL